MASTVPQIVRQPFYNAKLPLRELAEHALLQQIVEAAALVNSNGDGLYFHGRTGLYLEPAPGEATVNILKMAREGLRRDLTMALHKAVASREVVSCQGLKVKTNGDYTSVNLIVRPVESGPSGNLDTPLYLVILGQTQPCIHEVILSSAPKKGEKEGKATSLDSEARIAALQQELRAKEEYLHATTEELQTSNEELKSSNEEMQSVNEELQSTNEELETSKEELQSINEELATVNAELQTKVSDLARANNDMNNLLAGTGIATVFVDHSLRILRFTPAATRVINVIQSDIGRPVSHIVSNLKDYDTLPADTQAVLDTLVAKEVIVQATKGAWFIMRIMPYRTIANVIEGAVLTFVDISRAKQSVKDNIQEGEEQKMV